MSKDICAKSDSGKHDYQYKEDEYGSLGDGGSYEVYCCKHCDKATYVPLPD